MPTNPAASILGSLGGKRKTPAQTAARRLNASKALATRMAKRAAQRAQELP